MYLTLLTPNKLNNLYFQFSILPMTVYLHVLSGLNYDHILIYVHPYTYECECRFIIQFALL